LERIERLRGERGRGKEGKEGEEDELDLSETVFRVKVKLTRVQGWLIQRSWGKGGVVEKGSKREEEAVSREG